MKKCFAVSTLLFLSAAGSLAQTRPSPTQSPRRPSTETIRTSERPNFFQTESYSVTVESVKRKANNFTVTLVFESLSDKIINLRLGSDQYYWDQRGPYLLDEKSNKYSLQRPDSEGFVSCSGCSFKDLLPRTKLKSQFLFFGSGNGTTFTFMTTESLPVRGRAVVIKGLKVTSSDTFNDEAIFTTESYRVTRESVNKNVDSVEVTLVFESLSDETVVLAWGTKYDNAVWQVPYLTDENANKYVLRVRSDSSQEPAVSQTELLPGTKLKAHLKFYGAGNGTVFTLISKERGPKPNRPIVISGLTANSGDGSKKSAMEPVSTPNSPPAAGMRQLPSFETEAYRVVVSDVQRNAENITVTLIFESLLDKAFEIIWGRGTGDEENWQSDEPYLIDENADRYYLRRRDDGRVVDCLWCGRAELLPGTKLKTHFIFKASGNGTTFTFACRELSPKHDRPIIIKGLKAN